MAGHDTLKRDGGWSVELITPIKLGGTGADINVIDIRAPDFDTDIKWGQGKFPSTLSLLSDLASLPEATLRSLKHPDVERVMKAFFNVVSESVRIDLQAGKLPLATPPEEMTQDQLYEERLAAVDPIDPRFPRADGVVRRRPKPVEPQVSEDEEAKPPASSASETPADLAARRYAEQQQSPSPPSGLAAEPSEIIRKVS